MPIGIRKENHKQFLKSLCDSIEGGYRRGANGIQRSYAPQIVHEAKVVKGIPFYGYCSSERLYIKIYFYNPYDVPKIASMLISGSFQRRKYSVFEAHVPYVLQFMIDYNVVGMGTVRIQKYGRRPLQFRQSHSQVELDVLAQDILNLHDVKKDVIKPDNTDVKLVQTLSLLWEDERNRRRSRGVSSQPSQAAFTQLPRTTADADEIEIAMMKRVEQIHDAEFVVASQDPNVEDQDELIEFPYASTLLHELECLDNHDIHQNELSKTNVASDDFDESAQLVEILDWMRRGADSEEEQEEIELRHSDWFREEQENFELLQQEHKVMGTKQQVIDEINHIQSQMETKDILDSFHNDEDHEEHSDDDDQNDEMNVDQLDGSYDQEEEPSTPVKKKTLLKIHAGDFVSCRSPPGVPPYIAFVQSIDHTLKSASLRWMYSQTDVPNIRLAPNELLATDLVDDNPIATIISIVKVHPHSNQNQQPDDFYCKYQYHTNTCSKSKLSNHILQLFNWTVDQNHNHTETSLPVTSPTHQSSPIDFFIMNDILQIPIQQEGDDDSNNNSQESLLQQSLMDDAEMDEKVISSQTTHSTNSIPTLNTSLSPIVINSDDTPNSHHYQSTSLSTQMTRFKYNIEPPSLQSLLSDQNTFYKEPHYSNPLDYQSARKITKSRFHDFALQLVDYKRKQPITNQIHHKPGSIPNLQKLNQDAKPIPSSSSSSHLILRFAKRAPTIQQLLSTQPSLSSMNQTSNQSQFISQISMMTNLNKSNQQAGMIGFAHQQEQSSPSSNTKYQHGQSIMCMELHASSRNSLKPNPSHDSILSIYFSIMNDSKQFQIQPTCGILKIKSKSSHSPSIHSIHQECDFYESELKMIQAFAKLIRHLDPDVLLGYEIQTASWGYLMERCAVIGFNMIDSLSRFVTQPNSFRLKPVDEWGRTHQSGIFVRGRNVLNVWRLMRHEIKSNSYQFQNVLYKILGIRFPEFPNRNVTDWSQDGSKSDFVDFYFLQKNLLTMRMLNHLDLLNRTAELARVFGCDFFSVSSRGSQYRVESIMLRLSRPRNYVALSPSREQVARQAAIECIPLVMEPKSQLYTSPVLVLDFQSLYPSMVIAYNLCFSTCLGKITGGTKRMGVLSQFNAQVDRIKDALITPNGVMFVKEHVRCGVLPRMLREILETRVMVKQAIKKLPKSDVATKRLLDARQLGLKLIANVTYGYTSANFSGRMPCSDVADSIVQLGRRTLERAIDLIERDFGSQCKVVYGDTDSIFIECTNASKSQAFQIGKQIADRVTLSNPNPVKLQLEKVFHPCFLVTKKRYVGYAYDSVDSKVPKFDAKGIETVRRDSCPVVQKMMEKSIRIMFDTCDLSRVKRYCVKQWNKILKEQINIKDFIFAKEVKLGKYKKIESLPPAAIVAKSNMNKDPRNEPLYGDRVPYVVVHHKSSAVGPRPRLMDMVLDPITYLKRQQSGNKPILHGCYYIEKQIIPSLDRLFCLVGADVRQWYDSMPKKQRPGWRQQQQHSIMNGTLHGYCRSVFCVVCQVNKVEKYRQEMICNACASDEQVTAVWVADRCRNVIRHQRALLDVCMNCGCSERNVEVMDQCLSISCSVMFQRERLKVHVENLKNVQASAHKVLGYDAEDFF
ncbi:DNA polymerase zeta catalytic subunit [Acrasis kona]|uniref:DNA polymerase n=1 Tax=Acrasis kona TaxID=1008807 RepID=A0AAW2ZS42_9EUKA